jgi:hypothetical protein
VGLFVYEVAALTVAAVTLFGEGMAAFGFVGSIVFHVDAQFLWSVGKLALLAVGAEAFFCEVFAE